MSKKFNKEYKEKLNIETKKIQESVETKYKDDFDSLNNKFSQNEKEIEEQNQKIISLKEEIKTYIDKIKLLEKKQERRHWDWRNERRVQSSTFENIWFLSHENRILKYLLTIITVYIFSIILNISSYNLVNFVIQFNQTN